jgi:phosphate transport system substrate-binding protein
MGECSLGFLSVHAMKTRQLVRFGALVLTGAVLTAACGSGGSGSGDLTGTIKIDGSSTVGPLSEAAAELFREDESGVQITVGTSGTGGGFKKFCVSDNGTDIADASRKIKDEEAQSCANAGVDYTELAVANDGIALIVSKENTWAKCLTVPQLKSIWDTDSKVNNWNQVDPAFPDQSLKLFGPGTDSGTFDFFTAAINGEEDRSRSDYSPSEDDNVTVQGVENEKGGLGYFGLSYYEQNKSNLNLVQVDGGDGCVTPSASTVQSGKYEPLSRPLYLYVNKASAARDEVAAFITFYADNVAAVAEQALFVPLSEGQTAELATAIDELTA